jgi:hypothetical protein
MVYQFTPQQRGTPSTAVLFYLGPGATGGQGVGVGMLNTGERVQVLDSACFTDPSCRFVGRFIGYRRVDYSNR